MMYMKLDVLEDNDRIYECKTPTKRLVPDKRCTVYPPQWGPEEKGEQCVVDFNCTAIISGRGV